VEPPVTPGHEFSGYVVALGPGAGEHHNVEIGEFKVCKNI
jgi:threonine dehydrogenase-like Zn-dependent dehydrogenase